MRRHERAERNTELLIASFDECVRYFENTQAFTGPSLWFHERAIERQRAHASAADLLADERFFEYLYGMLPAWGMHRMGPQAAKVGDFDVVVASFREQADAIEALYERRITDIGEGEAEELAVSVWRVIAGLRVSTSRTKIVAGSKALHHALPDLLPPIDRNYTFRFFCGQTAIHFGEQRAFAEWFPLFCRIGREARETIEDAVSRGGFMATGPAKVIDNAIMGFAQLKRLGRPHPSADGPSV